MYNLNDIKEYSQCATWRNKLNKLFNSKLDSEDVHRIFGSINIPKYQREINGALITYYKKTDVLNNLYNGILKNKIQEIMLLRNMPIKKYNNSKNNTIKTYNYNKPLTKKEDNYNDDDLIYNNDENDMEKYSEYLINNVYENKNNMLHKIKLNENDLREIIKESILYILSESRNIKSKKLFNIIKQHGGIKSNHGVFDINNLTDDDIIGVFNYQELCDILQNGTKKYAEKNGIKLDIADDLDSIELNDNMYILAKLRGANFDIISRNANSQREKKPGDFELLHNKTQQRYKNRYPRKTDYKWHNEDAEEIFNNPFFRKGDGNWTPERKRDVINNIKNGKRWWDENK